MKTVTWDLQTTNYNINNKNNSRQPLNEHTNNMTKNQIIYFALYQKIKIKKYTGENARISYIKLLNYNTIFIFFFSYFLPFNEFMFLIAFL